MGKIVLIMFVFISFLLMFYKIQIVTSVHTEWARYPFTSEDCEPEYPIHYEQKCYKRKMPNNRPVNKSNSIESRIMNAELAKDHESPWSAFILVMDNNQLITVCGRVIINNNWILTVAHCLLTDSYQVFVGNNNKMNGEVYYGIQAIPHPGFNESSTHGCEYDLGLIWLENPIEYKKIGNMFTVNSVCLPKKSEGNVHSEYATFYGWGFSKEFETPDQPKPEEDTQELMKAVFSLLPIKRCQFCYCSLITKESDPRACMGDSGSGLVQLIGDNDRAVLIGIMEGGINDEHKVCSNSYSYWTAVPLHMDWISHAFENL